MFIKSHFNKSIGSSILKYSKIKDFMNVIEEQFVILSKALTSTLMKRLLGKNSDHFRSMYEHIIKMRDAATQLKSLEVKINF